MQRRPWPAELPDVFRGSEAVTTGVLSPKQLRDPRLRRLFTDVYSPRHVAHDHALDCRGAGLIAPPTARLTGRSLATVRGVALLTGGAEVEMVVPHPERRPGPRGIALRGASRGPLGSGTWCGVPVASSLRMGFDLAARQSLEAGVAHLDAVVAAGLLDLVRFRAWLDGRHEDDVVAVRAAAELCDGRAGSPPESELRVRLVRSGLAVEVQHEIRHRGQFVARVDLALVELRIAIEYDGAWHGLLAGQLAKDRRRLDRLREAGWIVVHVTADMMREPGAAEDAVRRAIAQRSAA